MCSEPVSGSGPITSFHPNLPLHASVSTTVSSTQLSKHETLASSMTAHSPSIPTFSLLLPPVNSSSTTSLISILPPSCHCQIPSACSTVVIFHLDYCILLLSGLPLSHLKPPISTQNCAAKIIYVTRHLDHGTPLFTSFHWLLSCSNLEGHPCLCSPLS